MSGFILIKINTSFVKSSPHRGDIQEWSVVGSRIQMQNVALHLHNYVQYWVYKTFVSINVNISMSHTEASTGGR